MKKLISKNKYILNYPSQVRLGWAGSITQLLNYFRQRRKGFTLIELLVVIGIIGILSALVLSNMQDARARARDAQRKSDLKQVKLALRMYYNDNQAYPAGASGAITGYAWGSVFGSYMKILPQDPLGTNYYYTKANDDSFTLYACLENKSDTSGSATCGSLSCSSAWCFRVSED